MHCPAHFILTKSLVNLAVLKKKEFVSYFSAVRGLGQGRSLFWCRVHGVCAVVCKHFDFRLILVERKLVC